MESVLFDFLKSAGASAPVVAVLAWLIHQLLAPEGRIVTRRQMEERLEDANRLTEVHEQRAQLSEERLSQNNEQLAELLKKWSPDRDDS